MSKPLPLPQPTEAHKSLAHDAGVWKGRMKFFASPDAPPMESEVLETNEMYGGFWLLSRFEGDFMGDRYLGFGQMGYDPETGEFVGTWIDSMSPVLAVLRGSHDSATRTLTMRSEGKDFGTGEPVEMRLVTRMIDDRHKRFEIHKTAKGADDWRVTMEIEYTRG